MNDEKYNAQLGVGWLLVIAVSLIEAYVSNIPYWLAVGIGILTMFVASIAGIIPLVGQVIYWFGMKHIMISTIGVWMPWIFWLGLVQSILVSLFMFLILAALMSGGYKLKINIW